MAFVDEMAKFAERVRTKMERVEGEAATKNALIQPFFGVLGYDYTDPNEVVPEYVADFAQKKRAGQFEKVDFAILINDVIVMIVEAKAKHEQPDTHDGQLRRYFNYLLNTKIAIVTNGIEYCFFTDLRNENVMDDKPFFRFNVLNYAPDNLDNLKLFHRDNFDAALIKERAEEILYLNRMSQIVSNILRNPSDDFIKFLINQFNSNDEFSYLLEGSRVTSRVIERFRPIVKKSIQDGILELMTQSISREMSQTEAPPVLVIPSTPIPVVEAEPEPAEPEPEPEDKSEANADELAVVEKVKALVGDQATSKFEIKYRKNASHLSLFVVNRRGWFLKFYASSRNKSLMTRLPMAELQTLVGTCKTQEVSASTDGAASRVYLESLDDLDKLADLIRKCHELVQTQFAQKTVVKTDVAQPKVSGQA